MLGLVQFNFFIRVLQEGVNSTLMKFADGIQFGRVTNTREDRKYFSARQDLTRGATWTESKMGKMQANASGAKQIQMHRLMTQHTMAS